MDEMVERVARIVLGIDLERLEEICEAERAGRLKLLPVAIGEPVFVVHRCTMAESLKQGVPESERSIQAKKRWPYMSHYHTSPAYRPYEVIEKPMQISLYRLFGTEVFYTREEAEAVKDELNKQFYR